MKKLRFRIKKESSFPKVSHTKGYYRFSKEFPSVTDSTGFRDNEIIINSPAKKASVRRKLALLFVCVFAVSFVVTSLCHSVSNLPVEKTQEQTTADADMSFSLSGYNAVKLTGDVLSYSGIESFMSDFKLNGINAVVIDFKDAQGYFYYKPSISTSAEALSKSSDNASKIINDFKSSGISVFALVSCFADDIYARNNNQHAAYTVTTPESGNYDEVHSIWYGGENENNAWLSPFSDEVLYYLNTMVNDINSLGVDGIIFDNAILPLSAELEKVQFKMSENYEISPQEKISQWISYANASVNCKTGICISSAQIISMVENSNKSDVFQSCDYVILDSRATKAEKGITFNSKQYAEPTKTPVEYSSALLSFASKYFDDKKYDIEIISLIDNNESSQSVISAIKNLKDDRIKSYILG